MKEILQDTLPDAPWSAEQTRRLPGIQPLAPGDWLRVDEAYRDQMALRDRLLAERRADVLRLDPDGRPAAEELLETVLGVLPGLGFAMQDRRVTRTDGQTVLLDETDPLGTLGRLIQEDLCILEKRGTEHLLTGAVLCFPANWSLEEKFLRPLTRIHQPVPQYDEEIAKRVQRLFDMIRPGQGLWRANSLLYEDARLFQPAREMARRARPKGTAPYIRSERQCLIRLPRTEAVVFSIHTYVIRRESLTAAQAEALKRHPIETPDLAGRANKPE